MKNRMTGFRRLRRGNLGLISARSLQAAEPGSGLSLSIWQDQTEAISSNSEKVPLMYARSRKDVAWSRERWDAYFSSHWSPKLFSCYHFLCLILRSPMPRFFPSLQPSEPYLPSLSKVSEIFRWHGLSANMLRRTWEYLVAFVRFFVAVRELCNKATAWHAHMCISLQ